MWWNGLESKRAATLTQSIVERGEREKNQLTEILLHSKNKFDHDVTAESRAQKLNLNPVRATEKNKNLLITEFNNFLLKLWDFDFHFTGPREISRV